MERPAIENNHGKPKTVGQKNPNELGLYAMSGKSGSWRVTNRGVWVGGVTSIQIDFSGKFDPNGIGPDQGFRIVRRSLDMNTQTIFVNSL